MLFAVKSTGPSLPAMKMKSVKLETSMNIWRPEGRPNLIILAERALLKRKFSLVR